VIDYFLIDEDYVGDISCYSEKVLSLPIGSMPFTLPMHMPDLPTRTPGQSDAITIAVAASSMKINPEFLSACRKAQEFSQRKLEFHFVPAFAVGLSFHVAKRELEHQVPGCVVYSHLPYDQYLSELQSCDLFINPYPYGNMNTIVDTVILGLEGLCTNGREPHAAIDAALFKRLNLPNLHVVENIDDYSEQIAKFANEAFERRGPKKLDLGLVNKLCDADGLGHGLGDILIDLNKGHRKLHFSHERLIKIQNFR
jgi:hypothetical protein